MSVRNYDPIIDAGLKLDPGSNPIPMAMFQDENFYVDYQNDNTLVADENDGAIKQSQNDDNFRNDVEKSIKKLKRTLRHKYKRSIDLSRHDTVVTNLRIKRLTQSQYEPKNMQMMKNFTQEHQMPTFLPYVRWCGTHDANMSKFDFISNNNQAILHFHSDFSISGSGFSATWMAIDISGCPLQILTSREGTIRSPNYPHFLLNDLECTFLIQAPVGKKVWLQIEDYELNDDSSVVLDLGDGEFVPFNHEQHLNDGVFVSQKEKLIIRLQTGKVPRGRGFEMSYKTCELFFISTFVLCNL